MFRYFFQGPKVHVSLILSFIFAIFAIFDFRCMQIMSEIKDLGGFIIFTAAFIFFGIASLYQFKKALYN